MSSADFDDTRDYPSGGGGGHGANLASSLSMSEADESEYLAAAVGAEHPTPPVTSARMRNEKLRFKSLFKRGTNPSSGGGGAIPKQPQVTYHFVASGECRLRDSPSDFLRRVTQPGKSVLL